MWVSLAREATTAKTAWTASDNDAWTSLRPVRRDVLVWLAAAWLLLPWPLNAAGCHDGLACTSWEYLLLFAWLTMMLALLRGNSWAPVAALAVAAGTVLVADQEPVGVAALVLLTGWSLFEAAAAHRSLTAQRRFLTRRLDAQTASAIEQDPQESLTRPPAVAAQPGPAEEGVSTGRAVPLAQLLLPGLADPVLRYYRGFRLGWAALLLALGGWTAVLTVLHGVHASGPYDIVAPLFYAALFLALGLRLGVASWRWAHRLIQIASSGLPTIAMTARRHGRWLSLYPVDGATEGTLPAASVTLMEDPDGAVGLPWLQVEVRGSLAEGGALVIRQGDRVLWPFEGARTGSRFAARVLTRLLRGERAAASHGRLLFDYRPRFWFQVWRRLHGRSRVTLWADGTLRRDSSFHTKQINLQGCHSLEIEDEGDLAISQEDRVFAASTLIRVRDHAGRTRRLRILRGMPLSKRHQLEQLAAEFMAEPTRVPQSSPQHPPGPPSWRSRVADACTWPAGLGLFGGFVVTGIMFESGVDSDATDPHLWLALADLLRARRHRPGRVPPPSTVPRAGLCGRPGRPRRRDRHPAVVDFPDRAGQRGKAVDRQGGPDGPPDCDHAAGVRSAQG